MERKTSDAQIRATKKYKSKTYEPLRIDVNRNERINDLLNIAKEKTGKSKAQYVIDALHVQLANDGITVDMLPPSNGDQDEDHHTGK